jgi:hypothetical protein
MGYYVSPYVQAGNFAGATTVYPGLGIGVIMNNKISVDVRYKFSVTENTPVGDDTKLYLHSQFGGVRCEYSIKPKNAIHLNFPIEIGIGEMEMDLKDSFENQPVAIPQEDAWFANIEPGVGVEINLLKYLKINFTGSYRFVSDVSFRNLTGKDLMGFNCSAGFKIGLF